MYNRYVRNDNGTYTRIPEESQASPPTGREMHAHHEYEPSHPPDDGSPGTAGIKAGPPAIHRRRQAPPAAPSPTG